MICCAVADWDTRRLFGIIVAKTRTVSIEMAAEAGTELVKN